MKLLIFLIVSFCLSSISADVLQEGKKKISFSFEVTNIDSYPDYIFLAYPVNQSNGRPMIECETVKNSKPIHLACRYGVPVIYAIKKDLFNPEDINVSGINDDQEREKKLTAYFTDNKNLIPSVKVTCSSLVDKEERYSAIQRQYKIESVKSDTMLITTEKILYKNSSGDIIDEKTPGEKGDALSPVDVAGKNFLYYALPAIALVAIVSIVLIRRMKKNS